MKKATDFFDPNDLIHAAFRYYLGRRTISANYFAQKLAESWLHIHRLTSRYASPRAEKRYDY
jgi:hypothetical protein